MWDKSKKLPNLCSKIAPASPGVSDKKSPAPGGLGASIPRPRPRSGGGGPGASGGLAPGVKNSISIYVCYGSLRKIVTIYITMYTEILKFYVRIVKYSIFSKCYTL